MPAPELPKLHDAVLERLELDWSAATVTLRLHPVPGEPTVLTAYGVQELHVDRWEPWGPSVFVNSGRVHQAAPGQVRIRLEMQTGDHILIIAEQFDLTPDSEGTPPTTLK